jgi:hypothetical protein
MPLKQELPHTFCDDAWTEFLPCFFSLSFDTVAGSAVLQTVSLFARHFIASHTGAARDGSKRIFILTHPYFTV